MKSYNKLKLANRAFLVLIILMSSLFLAACAQVDQSQQKIPPKNDKENISTASLESKWKMPISIPSNQGEFYKVIGWLSDQEIFYVTNLNQTSNLFLYNLLTGKSLCIYKTDNPILNVQISPSKKYLLIHSSASSNEGIITIIDSKGKELLRKSFTSYDLMFEWNPYNESKVLVTAFAEDWSFQLSLLDTKNVTTTKLNLPQPFIKWIKKDQVAYLNWNRNSSSVVAPLTFKRLDNLDEEVVFPNVVNFADYRDVLFTVSANEKDKTLADYSFFDKKQIKLFSFSIPHLTKFSEWLVPYYDYNEQRKQFLTFKPLASGDEEEYTDGFQLIRYDLQKGSRDLILDGQENVPIAISPSGNAALLGNSLEKMIDLNKKKAYALIGND